MHKEEIPITQNPFLTTVDINKSIYEENGKINIYLYANFLLSQDTIKDATQFYNRREYKAILGTNGTRITPHLE
jgi:hypothetical protein